MIIGAAKVGHGYQFGDSDLAAERLAEVARVSRDSTAEFLRRVEDRSFTQAVDLGCGPGFTTRLLAEVIRAGRTVGLDRSAHFLDLARRQSSAGIEFFEHDVSVAPSPCGTADLVYCRFLLSHLPDVRVALEVWATQLEPGGLLLLDELEAIETSNLLFKKYLGIVGGMLAASGSRLYVGAALEKQCPSAQLRLVRSNVRRMEVANPDAAAMFSRNVPNWRTNSYVKSNYAGSEIDELLEELSREAKSRKGTSEITWELRQMVLERI